MDGGRILKTVKTSYARARRERRLAEIVRELMKEQHKTMFIALRDGQFDHVLDSGSASFDERPPCAPTWVAHARACGPRGDDAAAEHRGRHERARASRAPVVDQ